MRNCKKPLLLLTLIFLLTATGCSTEKEPIATPAIDTLKISYAKLPLNVPSIVAKKQELFEKEFAKDNIKVFFPEITEGPAMTAALAAGSLNFCNALDSTSALIAAANGLDLKIIGIYSRAPEAFTIIVKKPGIKTVADLKGKTVAGPKGTILYQLLVTALEKKNLKIDDVNYVNMNVVQSLAALDIGDVDAALVAGPAVPKALAADNRVLITGKGLLAATMVIAVDGKFIQQHQDIAKRYLATHQQTLHYLQQYPTEACKLAAEESGVSLDAAKTMYSWYNFDPTITNADRQDLEKTQEFLLQHGLLTQKIELDKIILDLHESQ